MVLGDGCQTKRPAGASCVRGASRLPQGGITAGEGGRVGYDREETNNNTRGYFGRFVVDV